MRPQAPAAVALAALVLGAAPGGGSAAQLSRWPLFGRKPAAPRQALRRRTAGEAAVTLQDLACPSSAGALTCPGFPERKLKPVSSLKADAGVLLSISAYEEPWYLRMLVDNALRRTADNTIIVLHLNQNTTYPSLGDNDEDFEWLWSQPRVEVNCIRWPVRRWSGQILHSQLSNMQWARCRGIRSRHVVFQSSNMLWVRQGMEKHVAATGSSVPRVADAAECKRLATEENGIAQSTLEIWRHEACAPLQRPLADRTRQQHSADRSTSVGDMFASNAAVDEDYVRQPDPCYVPPFAGIRYVVQRKHEGSYYPSQDVYRMIDYLEEGFRDPKLMAERINATAHSRCLFEGRRTKMRPDLWSTEWPLEEVMLQSWVANFGLTNGTGNVMHKELKWKRRVLSCPEVAPLLAVPGIYAAKTHDLRDKGDTADSHRRLLSTCVVPPPQGR